MTWTARAVIFAGLLINAILAGASAKANDEKVYDPPRRPFAPILIEGKNRPICADLQNALAEQYFLPGSSVFSLQNMSGMTPAKKISSGSYDGFVAVHEVPAVEKDYLIPEFGFYLAGQPHPNFSLFDGTMTEMNARIAQLKHPTAVLGEQGFTGFYAAWGETRFYGGAGRVYFHTNRTRFVYNPYNDFELYVLSRNNEVERLCTVRLLPASARITTSSIVHGNEFPEGSPIGPLMQSFLRNFIRIYGNPFGYECGRSSSRIDGTFRDQIEVRLFEAYHRPWRVFGDGVTPDFSALDQIPGFEAWSTRGLWERRVYERFRNAPYDRIISELADFYIANFGYDGAMAKTLAARNFYEIASNLPFDRGGNWGPETDFYTAEFVHDRTLVTLLATLQKMIIRGAPMAAIKKHLSNVVSRLSEAQQSKEIDALLLVSPGRPTVARLLLDAGADPNAANRFHKTALMQAAHANDLESAKLLIDAGADVNAVTDDEKLCPALTWDGRTALMYAAENAEVGLIQLLLEAGADPSKRTVTQKDEHGFAALDRLALNPNLSEEDRTALAERME